jgi:hypothetical protein
MGTLVSGTEFRRPYNLGVWRVLQIIQQNQWLACEERVSGIEPFSAIYDKVMIEKSDR